MGELEILVRRYRRMMRVSALAWRRLGARSFVDEAVRDRDLAAAVQRLDLIYGSHRVHNAPSAPGLRRGPYVPPWARRESAHASAGRGPLVVALGASDVNLGPADADMDPASQMPAHTGARGTLAPAPTPLRSALR